MSNIISVLKQRLIDKTKVGNVPKSHKYCIFISIAHQSISYAIKLYKSFTSQQIVHQTFLIYYSKLIYF